MIGVALILVGAFIMGTGMDIKDPTRRWAYLLLGCILIVAGVVI
jgi:uncharacterized membrane protein HdeD (DUF308 family)